MYVEWSTFVWTSAVPSVRAHARMRGDPRSPSRKRVSCCCCCYCYASSRRLVGRRGYVAKIIAPVSHECLCANHGEVVPAGHAARICRLSLHLTFSSPCHSLLSPSFSRILSFPRVLRILAVFLALCHSSHRDDVCTVRHGKRHIRIGEAGVARNLWWETTNEVNGVRGVWSAPTTSTTTTTRSKEETATTRSDPPKGQSRLQLGARRGEKGGGSRNNWRKTRKWERRCRA